MIVAVTVFGVAIACIWVVLALRTRSVQVTQLGWLLFMPLAFLTTAFMPKELLSGWFKFAVAANPVDYVLVSVRALITEGWRWDAILPGLWVLVGMTFLLLAAATWEFSRATA